MAKTYDQPIIIQKIDEFTEEWADLFTVHASVNKNKATNEYLNSGAVQSKRTLVFEVRYFAELEAIEADTQLYRIVYRGVTFDIEDYDDFMMRHKTVKLLGVSY